MDLFDTRTMLDAIEEMKLPRTFLMRTFFNGGSPKTFATKTVEIDVVKGKRKMAPFVHPRLPGSLVSREGFRQDTYTPPYIQPKIPTEAELILKRSPGENPYASKPPERRAAEQLGKDIAELDSQIIRREEWMCAQTLTTGRLRVLGEGLDDTIDFLMSPSHKITLSTEKWDASGSDPIGHLRQWKRGLIAKDSGRTANVAVLSGEAVDAFQKNELVMKQLSTRRAELGIIKPETLPDGVTYLGYLNDPGVDLYSYDEWFLDDDGNEQPMIPAGGMILGATNTRNAMLYAAIQDLEAIESGLVEAARFPKSWVTKEPSVRWLKLQAAPLAGFLEPDAFVYAKVV
ncbi:major capsid protein [Pseudomonas sp. 273]|uniref:major capsid protein n=1 Tax=Pseudomonas sp. 273 TaxID=75692 RepID=UPI0023D888B8|nr:major capsid protein [Pseudomonas sp. 273]